MAQGSVKNPPCWLIPRYYEHMQSSVRGGCVMYNEIVCTKIAVNEIEVGHSKFKLKLGLELINEQGINTNQK
jgi:hypothetical protein